MTQSKQFMKLMESSTTGSDIASYLSYIDKIAIALSEETLLPYVATVYNVQSKKGHIPKTELKYYNMVTNKRYGVIGTTGDAPVHNKITVVKRIGKKNGLFSTDSSVSFLVEYDISDEKTIIDYYALRADVFSSFLGKGAGISDLFSTNEDKIIGTGDDLDTDTINHGEIGIMIDISALEYEVKSHTIPTRITSTYIMDLISLMGKRHARDFINGVMIRTAKYQLDRDLIRSIIGNSIYLKYTHVPSSEYVGLRLSALEAFIFHLVGKISTNTGISTGYYVICSSNVVAGLKLTKSITPIVPAPKSKSVAGKLIDGTIVIEDGFSSSDYLVVGTSGEDGITGGTFVSQLDLNVIDAIDPNTLEECLAVMARYDVKTLGNGYSYMTRLIDLTGRLTTPV